MATTASAILLQNGDATGEWVYFPGGNAALSVVATFGTGNVTLEMLGPDGVTVITNITGAAISANAVARSANVLPYPPGQYRMAVTGDATGVWARLDRIPS